MSTFFWRILHCFGKVSTAKNPLKLSSRHLGIKYLIWEGNNTFSDLCQLHGAPSLLHFMACGDDRDKNWLKSHQPCFCLQIGLSLSPNQVVEPFMILGWIPVWVHLLWNFFQFINQSGDPERVIMGKYNTYSQKREDDQGRFQIRALDPLS